MKTRQWWAAVALATAGTAVTAQPGRTPPDVTRRVLSDYLFRPSGFTIDRNLKRVKRMRVYVGTYTGGPSKGIYRAELNLEKGTLSNVVLTAETPNPSFLAIHPKGDRLYSVNETGDFQGSRSGSVTAFAIDAKSGDLRLLNQQSSRGGAPCHIVTDRAGNHLLVANYTGGNVAALPILKDGSLGPASGFVQHAGTSVNPRRQEAPHAHSINLDRDGKLAVAADLGLDRLLLYRFDGKVGTLAPADPPYAAVAPGSGPRHFAFHPNGKFAYVINEMLLTVTAFTYSNKPGVGLKEIQTISTLPDGVSNSGGYSTAEVQVHPTGRFLYGSNRGHHTIACFKIDSKTGRLTLVGHTSTQGKTPRNFGIDPSGRYLIAANQDSDTLVLFRIDEKSGVLTQVGNPIACPRPVCVKFLPLP